MKGKVTITTPSGKLRRTSVGVASDWSSVTVPLSLANISAIALVFTKTRSKFVLTRILTGRGRGPVTRVRF